MVKRTQCSECRRMFTPSPRARATQRVCGAKCRIHRDRKLARTRRRGDIDACRIDEQKRQDDCRHGRAKAREAATGAPCHAPASAPKPAELPEEVVRFVYRAFEASRATFLRDLSRKWPQPSGISARAL
jgi:hypothetical protein